MATYTVDTMPSKLNAGDIINCDYSGTAKSCALPKGTYKLECWGAQGGPKNITYGGAGGYSVGTIVFSQPQTVYIYVGQQGDAGLKTNAFNGGGTGHGNNASDSSPSSTNNRGGGGGGTDIRIGSDSLYARVIVAGGGGGGFLWSSGTYQGGYGGGLTGGEGSHNESADVYGAGGTQTSAGSTGNGLVGGFGYGGDYQVSSSTYTISGGGGGWYGGHGGNPAGGGSGYVYTSSTASNYPSGCLLNSTYYLTDVQTIAGNQTFTSPSGTSETGHSGNGYVRITVISSSGGGINFHSKINSTWIDSDGVYVKINGVWREAQSAYVKIKKTRPTVATHIYGVIWDGSSSPAWTRTDESASFIDPVPAVNNGNGSSPFDELYPWSEIKRVEDPDAGTLVEIPKFWYKWTRDGTSMKLQIATNEVDGFYVSPAHANRGDGIGERDFVYTGAYHCATETYKSTTGVLPQANITRDDARTNIHNLGNMYWQWDYAMLWTIRMLYLVEFADWNSQAKIGYGCGNNSSTENAGLCDAMTYHTGTNKSNRTTYGHTRYRWIEDLWGNVYDWCDGIYFSSANIYCIKNPANFSDSSGGTKVGTRPTTNRYISSWTTPTAEGFEYALYPSAVAGGENTYVSDYCYYSSSGVVLLVGGYYSQNQYFGLFYLNGYVAASSPKGYIGSRLMKLPNPCPWKEII